MQVHAKTAKRVVSVAQAALVSEARVELGVACAAAPPPPPRPPPSPPSSSPSSRRTAGGRAAPSRAVSIPRMLESTWGWASVEPSAGVGSTRNGDSAALRCDAARTGRVRCGAARNSLSLSLP